MEAWYVWNSVGLLGTYGYSFKLTEKKKKADIATPTWEGHVTRGRHLSHLSAVRALACTTTV